MKKGNYTVTNEFSNSKRKAKCHTVVGQSEFSSIK